jgi:hypothetical protein
MKRSLLLLFVLLPLFTFAEPPKSGSNFHWVSNQEGFVGQYGRMYAKFGDLNMQMRGYGLKQDFVNSFTTAGFCWFTSSAVSRKARFDAMAAFEITIPQRVATGKNDSLAFELRGWHLMTSLYGKDLIPGNVVALVVAPGVDWGKAKITRTLAGNGNRYRNGYIAPFARAELRFVAGPLAIGFRTCYRYDLTNGRWNKKDDGNFPDLAATKFSGLAFQAFFGWGRLSEYE